MPLKGQLIRNLTKLSRGGLTSELAAAMRAEQEIDAGEVRRRTPVRFGVLRGTVRVGDPVTRGGRVTVALMAGGGAAADYAIPVHEDLEANHPVGQAKFLESVVLESAPHMGARIARRMNLRKAMG